MNRIDQTFSRLKQDKRKAFIAYITAGDPDLKTTEQLALALEQSGVDILELGVPFSDPLADGPTIQAASQRALAAGTTLPKVLDLVKKIRRTSNMPLALMMYYNQIHSYGEQKFVKMVADCGVDGLIVPDLPPEEATDLIKYAKAHDVSTVFFMAPTTKPERMTKIARHSTGFIYYVSLTGVTGARQAIPSSVTRKIREAKKITDKPICIGFGISTPEQIRTMKKVADGVIVGSAIINQIVKHAGQSDLVPKVSKFVRTLSRALD